MLRSTNKSQAQGCANLQRGPLNIVIRELTTKLEVPRGQFDEAALRVPELAFGVIRRDSNRENFQKYIEGFRRDATGTVEFWYLILLSSLAI